MHYFLIEFFGFFNSEALSICQKIAELVGNKPYGKDYTIAIHPEGDGGVSVTDYTGQKRRCFIRLSTPPDNLYRDEIAGKFISLGHSLIVADLRRVIMVAEPVSKKE